MRLTVRGGGRGTTIEGPARRPSRLLGVLVVVAVAAAVVPTLPADGQEPAPDGDAVPDRVGGGDRFETAADISAAFFEPGVDRVYLATGLGFADALTGGVAADGAPLLLAAGDTLPGATRTELARLRPGGIVVLGGTAAVSASVEDELAGYTDGPVRRLSGDHRFATAAAISVDHFAPGATQVAFVATGTGFADALSGAPWAALTPAPLLLVTRDTVPADTRAELERLDLAEINVLGGDGAVSDAVRGELDGLADHGTQRVAGANRFATSAFVASIVTALLADDPIRPPAYVATGLGFADALAGGAAIAATSGPGPGPLLLVARDTVPGSVRAYLDGAGHRRVVVFGGTGAVSAATERQLHEAAGLD